MKILVDADACPGRNIIEAAAKQHEIQVKMFCDNSHQIRSDYAEVRYLDTCSQSVDIALANECTSGDIVVTQDFGVAALALGKKAYAISPKGKIYDNDNIDRLLFERHISLKERKRGAKTSSIKKRTEEDNKMLYENLIKLITTYKEL